MWCRSAFKQARRGRRAMWTCLHARRCGARSRRQRHFERRLPLRVVLGPLPHVIKLDAVGDGFGLDQRRQRAEESLPVRQMPLSNSATSYGDHFSSTVGSRMGDVSRPSVVRRSSAHCARARRREEGWGRTRVRERRRAGAASTHRRRGLAALGHLVVHVAHQRQVVVQVLHQHGCGAGKGRGVAAARGSSKTASRRRAARARHAARACTHAARSG